MHRTLAVWLVFLLLAAAFPPGAFAATPEELSTSAGNQLRAAERDMFSGKIETADQNLQQAAASLAALKAAAPEFAALKTHEAKYAKLRADIDRRLKKPAPASAETAKPAAPAASTRPAGKADETAAALAKAVTKAGRDVDYALGKLEALMQPHDPSTGVPPESPAAKETKARRYLAEAQDYLARLEAKYTGQLPSPNPEFDAARARIAAAQARVEPWLAALRAAAGEAAAARAASQQTAAQTLAEAERDVARMLGLHAQFFERLAPMTGNSLFHGTTVDEARAALAQIEAVEKDVLPALSPELGALADKYGGDSMAVSNRLFEMGWRGSDDPSGRLQALIEAAGNVQRTRAATATAVADFAAGLLDAFSGQLNDARIQRMGTARELLLVAARLDPANAEVRERVAAIDGQIAATAMAMEKDIDARTWAGHVASFPGPGNMKALAEAALEYFRNDRDWGKNARTPTEVLAVCIRGSWLVAERDVFGRVTCWRLPIHLAVTNADLRKRNIARVYDLSIVAREGPPGRAPQEPPFGGFWVGDNWMMRLDRLK